MTYSSHVTEVYLRNWNLIRSILQVPSQLGQKGKFRDHKKMQFLKPGKYSTINKSTTFAYYCYPYVNLLLNFASFLERSKESFFFLFLSFFQKEKNSGKKQKNHMPAYS